MKPMISIKLYDNNKDKVAQLDTEKVTKVWELLRETEYTGGSVRVDYSDGMYNEASFKNARQAKLLLSVFRERSLLDYIYNGGF